MCSNSTEQDFVCKSKAEILSFFRDKFLLIMYSQVRFDSEKFGEDSIIAESQLNWVTINTQV